MSRFNSWLNELQPEMFVELSPELAAERGIVHGGWLTVGPPAAADRGAGDGDPAAPAAAGRRAGSIHQIGLPFHWALRRRDGRRQRQRPDRRSWPTPT